MARKTVFSGIQPTGNIHIGNYLGALRNWVALQDDYDCIYCVVDLHAITVPQDPATFPAERRDAAKVLLAMGVDPSRSLLYFQSQVPQHTELSLDPEHHRLHRPVEPDDPVQGEGRQGRLQPGPLLLPGADGRRHPPLPSRRGAGRRGPEAAPGVDPRPGGALQRPLRRGVPGARADHPQDRGPDHVAAGPHDQDVQVGPGPGQPHPHPRRSRPPSGGG